MRAVAILLFGLGLGVSTAARAVSAPLLEIAVWTDDKFPFAEVVHSSATRVNVAALSGPDSKRVTIRLPNEDVVLARENREVPGHVLTWQGKVVGDPYSMATFVVVDGILSGSVRMSRNRILRVSWVDGTEYRVYEINAAKFPPDRKPISMRPFDDQVQRETSREPCDSGKTIDVVVAYTPESFGAAFDGGEQQLRADIVNAFVEANATYADSAITQRLRVVHAAEVFPAAPLSGVDPALEYAAASAKIKEWRDTFAADTALLIIASDDCGLAYIMESVDPSFQDRAFAVVSRKCLLGTSTPEHELGHVMGARHDWDDDDTDNKPFAFNHGYVNLEGATHWRTVMATTAGCIKHGVQCGPRIGRWSDPTKQYDDGDPLGIPGKTNEVQTLANTASTVANFRCSSSATSTPDFPTPP